MKRIIFFILAMTFSLAPFAQHHVQKKPAKKTAVASNKQHNRKKPAAKAPARRGKQHVATKAPTKAERRAATYSNANIRGLQGQRASIQKRIREQEQALRKNQADVKKRLEDLMALNGEIDQSQKKIDGIQKDIHHINGNIGILQAQLKTLQQQLQDRKNKYIRSMRYMSRHHTVQDKLMFIFSAKNLTQMYRRLSFIRQYSSYQKVQGQAIQAKQKQVNEKHHQLENVKGHKNTLLYKGKQEKTALEGKQTQQKEMVQGLQKQQKTIQAVIADQRQKDAAINAQIDRLVQQEVAKARARAAAEAKRKAAAAAAAKKRAEELARKKAAAEAAARENARRIAEAKAREAAAEAARRKAAEEARAAAEAARKAQEEAAAQAEAKAKAVKITSFSGKGKEAVFVGNVMELVEKIEKTGQNIQVDNIGESDFVVTYRAGKKKSLVWEWMKTAMVSAVAFFGAAFAIMTFNNDANVTDVFAKFYEMIIGTRADGPTILEASYSVGLALGILLFFNHFASWKITVDPTPIEVEMRLYEENLNKTLIKNGGRKESGVDVS